MSGNKPNPFKRTLAPKKEKFIESKSWSQVYIESQRKFTRFKLHAIPSLKALDLGFYVRATFFLGMLTYASGRMKTLDEEKIVCK
jgi:hypothetical protein